MTTESRDIYTTHLNRRARKRGLVNAGVGLAMAALCGNAYLSAEGAGVMALVGVVAGVVTFLLPLAMVLGARNPLRLTGKGVVMRTFIFTQGICFPWDGITGVGIHPRRNDPCFFWRSAPETVPQAVSIGWSLIAESPTEVMAAIKAELVRFGHVFEEEPNPEIPSEPQLVNPLKNFWS